MMRKGMTGELTPTMERYVERMQGSTQMMGQLISRQLVARWGSGGSARPGAGGLRADGAGPQAHLHFECIGGVGAGARPPLGGDAADTAAWPRILGSSRASVVRVRIEQQEKLGMWRLSVSTDRPRLLMARKLARLEQLLQRLGGTLSIQDEPPFELRLHLPAATVNARPG